VIARAVDDLLEASVVGSFTRVGYLARRRLYHWSPLESLDFGGKTAVVTGGTSGLGKAAAGFMARGGARVCIVGRDPERTERTRAELGVDAELADLSSLAETGALADRLGGRYERLDALILNAGVLTHPYTVTAEGNEVTLATHVLSQFLLTSALRPLLEASAARVISTSSGGMYTQPLDVDGLDPPAAEYDGPKAYARCKRAQVVLAEEWTRRLHDSGVTVNAMHPGWADTAAIRDALPGFSRLVGRLLRSPEEGADTIVWLSGAPEAGGMSGQFFLDRRSRPKYRLPVRRPADEAAQAARLWKLCAERASRVREP